MKRSFSLALILALILVGCGNVPSDPADTSGIPTDTTSPAHTAGSAETTALPADVDFAKNKEDMFTDRDADASYDASRAVKITLSGNGAVSSSDAARVSETTVTLTAEATYVISGKLDDGKIVVNAPDTAKVQIVLDGADITSKTSAAIYVLEADKVFVTLAEGSVNSISNGGSFVAIDENNINAALYSKCDITLNGSGTLNVTSPAGHGISGKDDLIITGGKYSIASASHGIDANDSIRIADADITVDAGKDGIHAENNDDPALGYVYISNGIFKIESEGDGISGAASLQIEGGDFDIVTGGGAVNGEKKTSDSFGGFMGGKPGKQGQPGRPGQPATSTSVAEDDGESIKGIKSSGGLLISGGTFKIDSADDAVHSNASVTVNGGSFDIKTGDDGFHADETLTITNGSINITESYEALEALHVKVIGADINAVASDDGINAAGGTDQSGFGGVRGDNFGGKGGPGGMSMGNGSIVISGGNIYIEASGDGIDANGTLEITGGYTVVCGPTSGDTATLDYDKSAVISGGTFIGTGARGMAQTFSDAKQGLISVSVGNQYTGAKITLTDKDGNVLAEHSPNLNFAIVIISSPDIISGEKYTLTIGKDSMEVTAD